MMNKIQQRYTNTDLLEVNPVQHPDEPFNILLAFEL
jgi:hypothetical protein